MTGFSYGIFPISYTIIIHMVFLRNVIFDECTYLNHLHLLVSVSFSYENDNNIWELFVKLFGYQYVFLWWLEDTPYFWFGGRLELSLPSDYLWKDSIISDKIIGVFRIMQVAEECANPWWIKKSTTKLQ